MAADLDSPAYWRSLYRRPADSGARLGAVGAALELEEGDLEATLGPATDPSTFAPIDDAAVGALVDALLEARLDALLHDRLAVLAAALPAASTAPPAAPTAPSPSRPFVTTPFPSRPEQSLSAPGNPVRSGVFASPGALPSPPGSEPSPAPPRSASSPPSPSASPSPAPPPSARPPLARLPADRISAIGMRAVPSSASTTGAVGAAMWERVPRLVGGPSALVTAGELSPDSISVLVMIDGNTSLRGLRLLVPHLDDHQFLAIVRDGVKRGLLDLG